MTEKLTVETAIAHRAFDVVGKPNEKSRCLDGQAQAFRYRYAEWICRYRMVGVGKDINFQPHGIDSVQVLQWV